MQAHWDRPDDTAPATLGRIATTRAEMITKRPSYGIAWPHVHLAGAVVYSAYAHHNDEGAIGYICWTVWHVDDGESGPLPKFTFPLPGVLNRRIGQWCSQRYVSTQDGGTNTSRARQCVGISTTNAVGRRK